MSEQLDSIVESEPQLLATGFAFTEGPLWHSDGYLTFVDMRRSLLLRWVPDGQIKVIRENTGGGNGCTLLAPRQFEMRNVGDKEGICCTNLKAATS